MAQGTNICHTRTRTWVSAPIKRVDVVAHLQSHMEEKIARVRWLARLARWVSEKPASKYNVESDQAHSYTCEYTHTYTHMQKSLLHVCLCVWCMTWGICVVRSIA